MVNYYSKFIENKRIREYAEFVHLFNRINEESFEMELWREGKGRLSAYQAMSNTKSTPKVPRLYPGIYSACGRFGIWGWRSVITDSGYTPLRFGSNNNTQL
jgi:hypothetical protein